MLKKYAELIVKKGINLQDGQNLNINAPIEALELVREITRVAYQVGAKYVSHTFSDDELTHIRYAEANDAAFEEAPKWLVKASEVLVEEGAAFLNIHAPNPELLKDIPAERVSGWMKVNAQASRNTQAALMSNKNRWNVVSMPTVAWATKVFPNETAEVAVQKLWDAIFYVTRLNLENPIEAWTLHNDSLKKAEGMLNDYSFDKLIFTSPGTNLEVGLTKGHLWKGGSAVDANGYDFFPNMPTEEVFTMPHRERVNGTVTNTKPLNFAGNVIDGFTLTFKDGEVVDYTAEVGYDTLKGLLETDEGARRLGEVALVPHDSPISNSNIIFYNTLFDENASCHVALGKAYPINIECGTEMSVEELVAHGANDSLTHVDFMFGSPEISIDGVKEDGTVIPLFRNGNWA